MYYQYCELYDFQNETINQNSVYNLFGDRIFSPRFTSNNILIENENYIILGCLANDNELKIKELLINIKNIENGITIKNNYNVTFNDYLKKGKCISCYITNSHHIICFYYFGSPLNINSDYYSIFIIYVLNNSLKLLNSSSFTTSYFKEVLFSKCIHLKDKIGIFTYYNLKTTNNISFI